MVEAALLGQIVMYRVTVSAEASMDSSLELHSAGGSKFDVRSSRPLRCSEPWNFLALRRRL